MATPKKRPKPKRAPVATTRRRARKAPAPRAEPTRVSPPPAIAESPAGFGPAPEPVAAIESAPPELEVPLASPEVLFAERVTPPETERPFPTSRRAIFFDVENTSRAQHIARVIDHLQIDRLGHRTEFVAVGNWRVIGHDTARLLARYGAHLVHSAPSVGVRDWSDLRIAVAAGAWLAAARPGDQIEIVSDDRAFDAVGDVAASLGIAFRRLSYRGMAGAPAEEVPSAPPERGAVEPRVASGERRGQRYRGRYRGRRDGRPVAPAHAPAPPVHAAPHHRVVAPVASGQPGEEPHTAPHDEIVGVVRDLISANPGRSVSIDAVANALKSRGFSRPPGSPRLITRLRRLKEIELNRAGMITLVDSGPRAEDSAARPEETAPRPEHAAPPREAVPIAPEIDEDEGPQPGNVKIEVSSPASDDSAARRRRRRGGRRRRGYGRPQPTPAP
jgi:hypothetical protein